MDGGSFASYLDIALVAVALFAVITWLKKARAGLAVVGALLLGAVYLAAREFQLELTAWVFQGFFAVFVIVLIVILQNDLRRLFERVASFGVRSRARGRVGADDVDVLCETVFELAGAHCGALIVLPGRDPVERYVEGGVRLEGRLSRPLLLSLFDSSSIGHDGAVILDGPLVQRFAVQLPLSANFQQIQSRGTRHSAAVGLSEVTDAFCICVSEERGEVSVAHEGRLARMESIETLRDELAPFFEEHAPSGRAAGVFRKGWADAALATALSIGLWQLFVAGAELTRKTIIAPVLVDDIDPGFEVEAIEPFEVEVELSGLRRDLYLLDPATVEVRLDASLATLGRRTFRLSPDDVRHPPDLRVRRVNPSRVVLLIKPEEEPQQPAGAEGPPPETPR